MLLTTLIRHEVDGFRSRTGTATWPGRNTFHDRDLFDNVLDRDLVLRPGVANDPRCPICSVDQMTGDTRRDVRFNSRLACARHLSNGLLNEG